MNPADGRPGVAIDREERSAYQSLRNVFIGLPFFAGKVPRTKLKNAEFALTKGIISAIRGPDFGGQTMKGDMLPAVIDTAGKWDRHAAGW